MKPRNFLKDYKGNILVNNFILPGNAQICDFGLSRDLNKKEVNYGGTKVYMSPLRLKAWKRRKRLPDSILPVSDSFSFGLSMIEMGNLLNLKNIALNEDEKLLK